MDCLTCKDIQDISLDILHHFAKFANDNKLTYYMAGGTLLGAVRHKGYIPWDDDIDLMMPRKDYNRLIECFKDDKYSVISAEINEKYGKPYARIYDSETIIETPYHNSFKTGVFIDIFPIDGFPQNEFITKLHLLRIRLIRAKAFAAERTGYRDKDKLSFVKGLLKLISHRSANYYSKRLTKVASKYDVDTHRYVGVKTTTAHLFREKNSKDIFDETVYLPFEDLMLPAPKSYDIYLTHLYGDYMTLPPVEKRVTEHVFKIYRKADFK